MIGDLCTWGSRYRLNIRRCMKAVCWKVSTGWWENVVTCARLTYGWTTFMAESITAERRVAESFVRISIRRRPTARPRNSSSNRFPHLFPSIFVWMDMVRKVEGALASHVSLILHISRKSGRSNLFRTSFLPAFVQLQRCQINKTILNEIYFDQYY